MDCVLLPEKVLLLEVPLAVAPSVGPAPSGGQKKHRCGGRGYDLVQWDPLMSQALKCETELSYTRRSGLCVRFSMAVAVGATERRPEIPK